MTIRKMIKKYAIQLAKARYPEPWRIARNIVTNNGLDILMGNIPLADGWRIEEDKVFCGRCGSYHGDNILIDPHGREIIRWFTFI